MQDLLPAARCVEAAGPATLFIYKLILPMSKSIATELLHSSSDSTSVSACPVAGNSDGPLVRVDRSVSL